MVQVDPLVEVWIWKALAYAAFNADVARRVDAVTNRVFLLSPANVQVTAEDKAKIAEGGFFNQS